MIGKSFVIFLQINLIVSNVWFFMAGYEFNFKISALIFMCSVRHI